MTAARGRLGAAGAILALALSAGVAQAEPAIIYSLGGKFDKSFNENSFDGAQKFKAETGVGFRDFEPTNASQRQQALRRFARDGADPIVVIGFEYEDELKAVARDYPKLHFAIIDDVVDLPNVASFVFKEEQGSYLVGLLAAQASKSGIVGFVGGMDVPLIRKFACGYAQGARAGNPSIKVIQTTTGTTPAAWNDPGRGAELARNEMAEGADVIFSAAGQTGLGILQATADGGKYGIGVDSNQNYLHPGHMLTSMVKRVDVAVYTAFKSVHDNTFKAGAKTLGLADGGIDYAVDQYNAALITPDMKQIADAAKAGIIAGIVKVHDYTTDNSCPVQ